MPGVRTGNGEAPETAVVCHEGFEEALKRIRADRTPAAPEYVA
jgi:hypothetical protein